MTITFQTVVSDHDCFNCKKSVLTDMPAVAGRVLYPDKAYNTEMYEIIHNDQTRVVHGVYYCLDCASRMVGHPIQVEEMPLPYPAESGYWTERWRNERRR